MRMQKIRKWWNGLLPCDFQFIWVMPNLHVLRALQRDDLLVADASGKLKVVASKRGYKIIDNILLKRSSIRVKRTIEYTLMSFLYEIRSPLDRCKIKVILEKKSALVQKILSNLELLSTRNWDMGPIYALLRSFIIQSNVRLDIIKKVELATRTAKSFLAHEELELARKKGVLPQLRIKGLSGMYIMRNSKYQKMGIFKPFDEEILGPNNPSGNTYRGQLGIRGVRLGIRVGECLHREVAAFYVDRYLQLGIVPKTEYACIAHSFFGRMQALIHKKHMVLQEKRGSFQEFKEGFSMLSKWKKEEYASIPLLEVQKLFILDVVIGHLDRHFSNILFDGKKIVAIDNGLSFSDREEGSDAWHWKTLSQCREPLLEPSIQCIKRIPLELLSIDLHKKCFLSIGSINQMRKRVLFLQECISKQENPFQIATSMALGKE
ncbi:MAG: hypothetical protein P4L16_06455 [Chlamydiales bacterium]|nr:hypothetical protein [Chlamydiales bacterium]